MDRHKLEDLRNKTGELLRFGSLSCIDQVHNIMIENFEAVLWFALDLTEPKPKPKHTIADHYPAGGLTATEPCMFCEDYEKLEEKADQLQAKLTSFKEMGKKYAPASLYYDNIMECEFVPMPTVAKKLVNQIGREMLEIVKGE